MDVCLFGPCIAQRENYIASSEFETTSHCALGYADDLQIAQGRRSGETTVHVMPTPLLYQWIGLSTGSLVVTGPRRDHLRPCGPLAT